MMPKRSTSYSGVKAARISISQPLQLVAVGICASSGGVFRDCYNVSGGVDTIIPVDVYVPGCSVRPEALIEGVVKAIGVLEEKRAKMEAEK